MSINGKLTQTIVGVVEKKVITVGFLSGGVIVNQGGGGGSYLLFTQATPATEWIINHNFGQRPNVSLLSVGGVEIIGGVVHSTINQVRAYVNPAQAGLAIISL